MVKKNKRKALGKGLSILLNDENKSTNNGNIIEINIDNILSNPDQPILEINLVPVTIALQE